MIFSMSLLGSKVTPRNLIRVSCLIITITLFSNLIGALTALFFTNRIPEIGQLHQPIILSLIRQSQNLSQ